MSYPRGYRKDGRDNQRTKIENAVETPIKSPKTVS